MEGEANSRVKVIIRIRPLSNTERRNGHQNILQGRTHSDQSLTVVDPSTFEIANKPEYASIDPSCWSREFSFDKCLWSDPRDSGFADQETVFEEVGRPVLTWILDGYNCCVFAFGQTGAGKSYTMMGELKGDPANFGLIPRICFGLFEGIELRREADYTDTVMFSHMEIYNENVRDLLAAPDNPYLKVREHPQRGIFVSNLTIVKVTNFEDIMSLVAIGDKNRTIATTNSNLHSSRSHAIVTLTVFQRVREQPMNGLPTSALKQVVSRVHLVDLAGSERVTLSGAQGLRLKEANNINKSLSVLGDVIKCLGDNKNKRGHIPYRNSTLTLILKDSLGGNSHTVMLTNVSPSSFDYEETVSSLKYADRAKKVRMRVNANVTSGLLATDQSAVDLVPLLQAEVNKLREMLRAQQQEQQEQLVHNSRAAAALLGPDTSQLDVVRRMSARVAELEKDLADRESLIQSLEVMRLENLSARATNNNDGMGNNGSGYYQQVMSPGIVARSVLKKRGPVTSRSQPVVVLPDEAVDTTLPRIVNLNQDPLFSECLVYYLPAGLITAGSDAEAVDVLISGPDVLPRHCTIHNDGEHMWVEPLHGACVYLNGELVPPRSRVKANRVLGHLDRIAFGRFHLFRFEAKGRDGSRASLENKRDNLSRAVTIPGWEFAQQELTLKLNSSVIVAVMSPQETRRPNREISPTSVRGTVTGGSNSPQELVQRNSTLDTAALHQPMPVKSNSNYEVDVRASMPNLPLRPPEQPRVAAEESLPAPRGSALDSQYEEIFARARRQLERIAHGAPDTNAPVFAAAAGGARTKPLEPSREQYLISPSNGTSSTTSEDMTVDRSPLALDVAAAPPAGGSAQREGAAGASQGSAIFEKEALALHAELAHMQRTLQDRMQRYSALSRKGS